MKIAFPTIMNTAAGLVLVIVSIPLMLGKVPPNYWYGFRTRKTLSDGKIWYLANRAAGADLLVAGIFIMAAVIAAWGLSGWFPGLPVQTIDAVISIVAVSIALVHSSLFIRKL